MVGLIAGIENLDSACLRAEICISVDNISCGCQGQRIEAIRRERTRARKEEAIVAGGADLLFLERTGLYFGEQSYGFGLGIF